MTYWISSKFGHLVVPPANMLKYNIHVTHCGYQRALPICYLNALLVKMVKRDTKWKMG